MTSFAGEVGHKADAAGVVLVPGVIQSRTGPGKGRCHQSSCRLVRFALAVGSGRHWPVGGTTLALRCDFRRLRLAPLNSITKEGGGAQAPVAGLAGPGPGVTPTT